MLHSTTMTAHPRWLATLALLLTLWATPAHAGLSAADERGVREVVQAQLAAFAGDDAEKAFSYAAPNIRQSLGTAERFMAMVRSNYAVVYRPASVTLLRPEGANDQAVQRAQMTDANGAHWMATYTLQKQKNKLWRITGCVIMLSSARMV